MKQTVDLSFLMSVMVLPIVLALGAAIAGLSLGETFGPDDVAFSMMMILMFSALSAHSLGKKAVPVGPRALAQYCGAALGMFGMLIVGDAPPAEMTLGQMLQGWWPQAIVFLGMSLAMIKPLRALRRHPRGLWILTRLAILLAACALMVALLMWEVGPSIAQSVWVFLVFLSATGSGGVTVMAYQGLHKTGLGKIGVLLAQAVAYVALMFVVMYVLQLGQAQSFDDLPIGGVIGGSIGATFALTWLHFRKLRKKAGA